MTSQFAIWLALCLVAGMPLTERLSGQPRLARRAYLSGLWGGIIGARLWYSFQYGDFGFVGGWASWGFVLGGTAGAVSYLRIAQGKWAFGDFADSVAPALAGGGSLMRLNCFSIGCNFGSPTGLPWAVRYGSGSPAFRKQLEDGLVSQDAPLTLPIHPAQLYESFALLIALGAILLLRSKRYLLLKGEIFLGGVLFYSTFRFLVEFLRDDAGGYHPLGLTFAQATSIGTFLVATLLVVGRRVGWL